MTCAPIPTAILVAVAVFAGEKPRTKETLLLIAALSTMVVVVFVYGGVPFLRMAIPELRNHQPGMMTLISLAIVVAFITSWAGTLGWFEVEIWWELATLVTIMLLGHWLEMRSVRQASGALGELGVVDDRVERSPHLVGHHRHETVMLLLGLMELQRHRGKTRACTFPGWRRKLTTTQKLQLIIRSL